MAAAGIAATATFVSLGRPARERTTPSDGGEARQPVSPSTTIPIEMIAIRDSVIVNTLAIFGLTMSVGNLMWRGSAPRLLQFGKNRAAFIGDLPGTQHLPQPCAVALHDDLPHRAPPAVPG